MDYRSMLSILLPDGGGEVGRGDREERQTCERRHPIPQFRKERHTGNRELGDRDLTVGYQRQCDGQPPTGEHRPGRTPQRTGQRRREKGASLGNVNGLSKHFIIVSNPN